MTPAGEAKTRPHLRRATRPGGSLPRLNAAATGPVFELRSGLVDLAGA
jgi:hypothetical protein